MVFYRESIARCRQNRWDFSLRVLVRTRSIMRKENIDLFKYSTFPYGEWFEGSNKAAGKLPVVTTLSLLNTVVVTRRRRRVTSFAFPSGARQRGASADSTYNAAKPEAAAMPTVTATITTALATATLPPPFTKSPSL